MIYKTHISFALVITLPIAVTLNYFNLFNTFAEFIVFVLFSLLSALIPDLDTLDSKISKTPLRLISYIIVSFSKHRGFTHKFYSNVLYSAFMGSSMYLLNNDIRISLLISSASFIGYFTHLLGDSSTIQGINMFSKRKFYILPYRFRFYAGSEKESAIYFFLNLIIISQLLTIKFTEVLSNLA